MAETYGKKVGLSRRDFLKTANGMALAFVAMNQVFGNYFQAHAEELTDIDAISELTVRNQFIFDVQTHQNQKQFPLHFLILHVLLLYPIHLLARPQRKLETHQRLQRKI